MIKNIPLIVFLSLGVAFSSFADDSDRIDHLEKEVQELKFRISKLESLHSNPSADQEVVTSGEGWKSITNWRKLTTDMGYDDVEKILGSPERMKGGVVAYWFYENGGKVTFVSGRLHSWEEP